MFRKLAFIGVVFYASFSLAGGKMIVTSFGFQNNENIPVKFTRPGAGGKNISIPLRWVKNPKGVVSYAVTVVDMHPRAKRWVHWMVINLPPSTLGLEEGASGKLRYGLELKNSFGKTGYGGPQPPAGTGPHKYKITVYALDSILKLKSSSLGDFLEAVKGKILDKDDLTGIFEAKK
jgi:Raf kinase inhibitor-like YbhB/YbcL family protein